MKQARLLLEDGTCYNGYSRSIDGISSGEVVFNTSMTGYQEIVSDPSYCNQIVVMTFPMIGNYGINKDDFESEKLHLSGLVTREVASKPNNWRSEKDLSQFLAERGILCIDGIDTRALTKHLRSKGTMQGVITTGKENTDELLAVLNKKSESEASYLLKKVSTSTPYSFGQTSEETAPHIVIIDLGLKKSIASFLARYGYKITIVPHDFQVNDINALKPDGLVIPNGPGNPELYQDLISVVREFIGVIPLLGICLGHQILALSLGAKTYKLKYGHRGSNHPVEDILFDKIFITSQNHGYAVHEESMPANVKITQYNKNDGTVEGFCSEEMKIISVQYHPEAYPGPADSTFIFDQYNRYVREGL